MLAPGRNPFYSLDTQTTSPNSPSSPTCPFSSSASPSLANGHTPHLSGGSAAQELIKRFADYQPTQVATPYQNLNTQQICIDTCTKTPLALPCSEIQMSFPQFCLKITVSKCVDNNTLMLTCQITVIFWPSPALFPLDSLLYLPQHKVLLEWRAAEFWSFNVSILYYWRNFYDFLLIQYCTFS